MAGWLKLPLYDGLQNTVLIGLTGFEREAACKDVIERLADRIDIAELRDVLKASNLLRRHVADRPCL